MPVCFSIIEICLYSDTWCHKLCVIIQRRTRYNINHKAILQVIIALKQSLTPIGFCWLSLNLTEIGVKISPDMGFAYLTRVRVVSYLISTSTTQGHTGAIMCLNDYFGLGLEITNGCKHLLLVAYVNHKKS